MKLGVIILFVLTLTAVISAAPCSFQIEKVFIDTQPGCPQELTKEQAEVYVNEDYYICGQIPQNTGKITAHEPTILEKQTVAVVNGNFELHGRADTDKHKVYYIETNYTNCELNPITLEVKDKCDQVAPTVRVLPKNAVQKGETFTIEVDNLDETMEMKINGLTKKVNATIQKKWSKTFESNQCCDNPPCSCTLNFAFTQKEHPICKDTTTSFTISIKPPQGQENPQTEYILTIAITIIVLIGTIIVILLNKTK